MLYGEVSIWQYGDTHHPSEKIVGEVFVKSDVGPEKVMNLPILSALFEARQRWPLFGETSGTSFLITCVAYVVFRIVAGRIKRKYWPEILADGATLATGSIWIGAAVFVGFFAVVGIISWLA